MASSLVITINSGRTQLDNGLRHIKSSTLAREECRALSHYFSRMGDGLEQANFSVQSGAVSPVRAASNLTLTYGSLADGSSTCVIGGTTLTAKTSPSTNVQFGIGANLAAACANLAACINASPVLSLYCSAAVTATGVVTVTAHAAGTIGNFVTTVGGTGIVAANATLVGGAGGATTAAVSYSRGL